MIGEVEARKSREAQGYYDKLHFEEVTDIAERLSYAIDVEIPYELRGEHLYALTDIKERPFVQQTAEAIRLGQYEYTDDKAFQLQRLIYEHQEAQMADALGRNELSGNVLIKFSKVPDAVVNGETTIQGYRRDILRSFVRLYYRQDNYVKCRILSIDQNNQAGLEAVGELLDIDMRRDSESILADHTIVDAPDSQSFVGDMTERLKSIYDTTLYAETGQQTYAGSQLPDAVDAHSLVLSRVDLMRHHVATIDRLLHTSLTEAARQQLLETERRRTAAAIKLSLDGVAVTSSADSTVSNELEIHSYEGDCPTVNGMNQAASLEANWVRQVKGCPLCGRANVIATKSGDIISGSCGCWTNVCTDDQYVNRIATPRHSPLQTSHAPNPLQSKQSIESLLERRYGKNYTVSKRLVVGGIIREVRHRKTGELVEQVR